MSKDALRTSFKTVSEIKAEHRIPLLKTSLNSRKARREALRDRSGVVLDEIEAMDELRATLMSLLDYDMRLFHAVPWRLEDEYETTTGGDDDGPVAYDDEIVLP